MPMRPLLFECLPLNADAGDPLPYLMLQWDDPDRLVIIGLPWVDGFTVRSFLRSLPDGLPCIGVQRSSGTGHVAAVILAGGGVGGWPHPPSDWPWYAPDGVAIHPPTRRALRAAAHAGAAAGWPEFTAWLAVQDAGGWFDGPIYEVHALDSAAGLGLLSARSEGEA